MGISKIVRWGKNTLYTALVCGVMGAGISSQSDVIYESYGKGLKTKIMVLQDYKGKGLEYEVKRLQEQYNIFSNSNNLGKTKQMMLHPKEALKDFKNYGGISYKGLLSKKSVKGLEYGALGGLILRLLMPFVGIRRKRRKKKNKEKKKEE